MFAGMVTVNTPLLTTCVPPKSCTDTARPDVPPWRIDELYIMHPAVLNVAEDHDGSGLKLTKATPEALLGDTVLRTAPVVV